MHPWSVIVTLIYSTRDIVPQISLIKDTECEKSYMLSYNLKLPESFDFIKDRRSTRMVVNKLSVIISLKKSNKWLNIDFEIDNKSIDHRLRAIYRTGFKADISFAPTAFDIIAHNRTEVLDKISNGDRANSGFICIDDKAQGIAVLNKGIYEYEHLNDQDGSIALTLIRATGYISRAYGRINEISPDMIAEGNNCIRKVKLQTGIYPYEGDYLSEKVLQASNAFLCPLLPYFQPVDLKKFSGGRPAVQGSCISEIFYREDDYNGYTFSPEASFLHIHGENIMLSALKKAESGKGLILRVYNSGDSVSDFAFSCPQDFLYVKKVNLNEEELEALSFEGNKLNRVSLKPKEILTLKYALK
jgi:alpha-mannosidase